MEERNTRHEARINSVFQSYVMMHLIRKRFEHARNFLILVFGLLLLGAMMIVGSLGLILCSAFLSAERRKKNARAAITGMFRLYFQILQCLNVLHLDLTEIDCLRTERGLILASNHPSLLDALLITSRLSNVVCIMKEQVLKNILFGHGAKLAGYIPNSSVRKIMSLSATELQTGSQLLLFPEGTRTCFAAVNTFQATAALIAKRTGADVQTIMIESDSGFLGKGWPIYRAPLFPVHFRVRMGKRFSPQQDVKHFTAELQGYFEQELGHKQGRISQAQMSCVPIEMQN